VNLLRMLLIATIFLTIYCGSASHASGQTVTIGNQCSRPGVLDDNLCTVLYHVKDNPANNKVCLWRVDDNSLISCEGRTRFGGGFDYIPTTGATLEFRRHSAWPGSDPLINTNPGAVRAGGTLLKTQFVTSRFRTTPTGACDTVVMPGQSIQGALNTLLGTVCLSAGNHVVTSQVTVYSNQTLRSENAGSLAVIKPATGGGHVFVIPSQANVTIKDLVIDGQDPVRPGFGILSAGSSNVLIENVQINRATIGVGVSQGSSNVELRSSQINYAGDGLACDGCASPSVWITDSSDVRVTKTLLKNLGVGPQGDGELACYNTPGLVVTNTTVEGSGAAGMYIVNCDYAVVTGNDILGSREWGLDIVNTGYSSGSDYGLYSWNLIQNSRNGGGVIKDSKQATFQSNTYTNNRQGGSGSCNGMNRRGNTDGYYYINDVSTPWPVVCND
jgi:hypothetical protein